MNPLEEIENGIIEGDWVSVCRGYENLTGKVIKTKGISLSSNKLIEQIEKLINDHKKTIILNPYTENNPPPSNPSYPPIKKTETIGPFASIDKNGNIVPTRKGHYGNITQPLTEDVPLEEINKNIEKATVTKERKTKRNPPKKYSIKCSQCEQNFESDRQESKDFGQKCPKCLQETINGKVSNG